MKMKTKLIHDVRFKLLRDVNDKVLCCANCSHTLSYGEWKRYTIKRSMWWGFKCPDCQWYWSPGSGKAAFNYDPELRQEVIRVVHMKETAPNWSYQECYEAVTRYSF